MTGFWGLWNQAQAIQGPPTRPSLPAKCMREERSKMAKHQRNDLIMRLTTIKARQPIRKLCVVAPEVPCVAQFTG